MATIEPHERVRALLTALYDDGWKITNVDIEPEMPGYNSLLSIGSIDRALWAIMLVESSIVWLENGLGELNWFVIMPNEEEDIIGMSSYCISKRLIALRTQQ